MLVCEHCCTFIHDILIWNISALLQDNGYLLIHSAQRATPRKYRCMRLLSGWFNACICIYCSRSCLCIVRGCTNAFNQNCMSKYFSSLLIHRRDRQIQFNNNNDDDDFNANQIEYMPLPYTNGFFYIIIIGEEPHRHAWILANFHAQNNDNALQQSSSSAAGCATANLPRLAAQKEVGCQHSTAITWMLQQGTFECEENRIEIWLEPWAVATQYKIATSLIYIFAAAIFRVQLLIIQRYGTSTTQKKCFYCE